MTHGKRFNNPLSEMLHDETSKLIVNNEYRNFIQK